MEHYSTVGGKKTLVRTAMHSNAPLGKWRPENRSNSSGPHLWGSCSILRSSPETSAFLIWWPLRGKQPVEYLVAELSVFRRSGLHTGLLVSQSIFRLPFLQALFSCLQENKGTADFLLYGCTEKLPLLPGPGLSTDTYSSEAMRREGQVHKDHFLI